MSFKTAKEHLQNASDTTADESVRELAEGIILLSTALQRGLSDIESKLRTLESKINHLQ